MSRTPRRATVAIGAGAVALALAAPALAAPVALDDTVALNSHTWTFTNEGGFDDSTPPACEDDPGLAVDDASSPLQGDAFDEAYLLTVGGTVLADGDGTVDRTTDGGDEVLTADPVALAGLDVSVQFRVFADGDVLRQVVTLVNPGAAPVATPVAVHHNWGADSSTEVHASESGDRVLDAADRWVITTESNPATPESEPSTDPINTSVLFGPGAVQVPPSAVVDSTPYDCAGQEGLTATFDVTVPAGATRHLVFFGRISDPDDVTGNDEAVTNLPRVFGPMSTASPLWAGVDAAQQANVLNWAQQVPEPPTTEPTTPSTPPPAPAPAPTPTAAQAPAAVTAQPQFTG